MIRRTKPQHNDIHRNTLLPTHTHTHTHTHTERENISSSCTLSLLLASLKPLQYWGVQSCARFKRRGQDRKTAGDEGAKRKRERIQREKDREKDVGERKNK